MFIKSGGMGLRQNCPSRLKPAPLRVPHNIIIADWEKQECIT